MTSNETETRRFTKSVDILEKNEEEQRAIGAVLVPSELDYQLDFLRPDAIERLFNPEADVGVLHAAFPSGVATTEHRILSESEEIGGDQFPEGTWVADRKYRDGELWELVKDGVLGGFSIGGKVTQQIEYGTDEMPDDVRVPDGVPADEGAVEIVDGRVDEVSDVDVPAVPRADHAVVKSDLGKSVLEEVSGKAEFLDLMAERGHSEEDAERLWAYMQENSDHDPAEVEQMAESGGEKDISDVDDATLGERVKAALFGSSGDDTTDEGETPEEDGVEKAGRTLNTTNIRRAKAAHDLSEQMLAAADVEPHSQMSRTYDGDRRDSFELTQIHTASKSADSGAEGGGGDEDGGESEPAGKSTDSETMTEDNEGDETPEWAKSLIETVEENSEKIDDALDGEESGEEEAEKDADGGSETETEEPPEWAEKLTGQVEDLAGQVEENAERIGKLSNASASTDQVGGSEGGDGGDGGDDEVEKFKNSLVGLSGGD